MKRILVVDDDASIRHLFERLGAQHHWDVVSVACAQDAFTVLRDDFGCAFLDIDLGGGIDGVSVAIALVERMPALYVVMMSGNPGHAERVAAAGLGKMLPKPFELSALAGLVGTLLRRGG